MSTSPKPVRITRNFMRGPQVVTARGLRNLSGTGKAIFHSGWHKIIPATFIISMPFYVVMDMIGRNYLFEIRPAPQSRKKCPWPVTVFNKQTGMYERKN